MAKEQSNKPKQPDAQKQPVAQEKPAVRVALDEFCARLSETEKRYTLLAAFHGQEVMARRVTDTSEAYQERFSEFLNKPA